MHTLGPWKEEDDGKIGARVVIGDGQQLVALVYGRTLEEQRANVAVICAMPVWQDIDTAPKDGTVIDLWIEDQGRFTDCHWGHTEHTCGEAGQYCDSEWHAEKPGWCWGTLNEQITGATHWMPRPADPV